MGILRNKLQNFMQGRYGVDALNKCLLVVALICAVVSMFTWRIFYLLGLCIIVYVYFRMFSKNYEKRYRENRAFINARNQVTAFFRRQKSMMTQRKTHHIYKCARCKQKIRIPKGRGKIVVTCPKCKYEFQKKS